MLRLSLAAFILVGVQMVPALAEPIVERVHVWSKDEVQARDCDPASIEQDDPLQVSIGEATEERRATVIKFSLYDDGDAPTSDRLVVHVSGGMKPTKADEPTTRPAAAATYHLRLSFAGDRRSELSLPVPATIGDVAFTIDVPPDTWVCGIELDVAQSAGCGPILITGCCLDQVPGPASPPTTVRTPGERVAAYLVNMGEGDSVFSWPNLADNISTDWLNSTPWRYQDLFEGTDREGRVFVHRLVDGSPDWAGDPAPKRVALRGQRLVDFVEGIPIKTDEFAVTGMVRAFSVAGDVNTGDVRLDLWIRFADGSVRTATFHPGVAGENAFDIRGFRLPIKGSGHQPPTRIYLYLTMPQGAAVTLEDVAIVEPSADPPAAPIPEPIPSTVVQGLSAGLVALAPETLLSSSKSGDAVSPVIVWNRGQHSWDVLFRRPPIDSVRRVVPLLSVDNPDVGPGVFGYTATVDASGPYQAPDFTGSAYFELTAYFPDGSRRVVGTTAAEGPAGRLTGRVRGRPMQVVIAADSRPVRLELSLVSDGVGNVNFTNLALVKFDPPTPATQPAPATAAVSPPPWWTLPRVTRPAGFAVLALMAAVTALFLIPSVAAQSWGLMFVLALIAQAAFAWGVFVLGRGVPAAGVAPLLAAPAAWLVPLMARSFRVGRVRRRELRRMILADAAV